MGAKGVLRMEALTKHPKLEATLFSTQLLGARIDPSGLPGSPQHLHSPYVFP